MMKIVLVAIHGVIEIQKCGQILCAHKPYFLMPGHICITSSLLKIGATSQIDFMTH